MTRLGLLLIPASYLAAWCLFVLRVPWAVLTSPGGRAMLEHLYRLLCFIGSHDPMPVVIDTAEPRAYVLLRCSRECGRYEHALTGDAAIAWLEAWVAR